MKILWSFDDVVQSFSMLHKDFLMICLFLILIEKGSLTLYPSLPHAGVLNSRRSKETCWKFGLSAKTSPFNGGESIGVSFVEGTRKTQAYAN